MSSIFPLPINKLPLADILIDGLRAYVSQSAGHQILFMEFEKEAVIQPHSHSAQAGFVIEGRIDLTVDGETRTYIKGDCYQIPAGVIHSAKIYAGYADITFFDDPNRYSIKE